VKIAKPIVIENYGFSRASIATYYNASGYLTEAAVNELRLGFNPATLIFIGPIIEDAVENELRKSNDFLDDAWIKIGSPGVDYTLVPNAGISPDFFTNSATSYSRLTSFTTILFRQAVSSGLKVFSIFVKSFPDESCTFRLTLGDETSVFAVTNTSGGGFESNTFTESLPNGWFRFSLWANITLAGFAECQLLGNIGARCLLFGAQVEITSSALGLRPSSYIATDTTPVIRAADIQSPPPTLVFSNVLENDAPEWNSARQYVAGEKSVVRGDYHRVYESVGSNINQFPPDNPEEWIDQGATNRWRMFDMDVGAEKQTTSETSDNTIQVLLNFDTVINTVTLLNLFASRISIIMRDSVGTVVYEATQTGSRITTLALTDLPPFSPSTLEMTLSGGDAIAKIGKMIVGFAVDIGCTRYGTSVGIIDFSRKERDAFGNNFIVERRYVDRVDFDIQLLTSRVDEVKTLLAEVRATPVLYLGDDRFQSTIIYGFYRDFSIVLSGPKYSDGTLQVEGI
jgi:hypothetical protein